MRSGTIKKRESFVPETIKKRLESCPGWLDLVSLRKKQAQYLVANKNVKCLSCSVAKIIGHKQSWPHACDWCQSIYWFIAEDCIDNCGRKQPVSQSRTKYFLFSGKLKSQRGLRRQ